MLKLRIIILYSILKNVHNQKLQKQQQQSKNWHGTLVPVPEGTGANAGVQTLNDLLQVVLTPARVFTPTESIKLTCVKSRMTVWTFSPWGMNLCISSGNVVLMTIGGYFTSSSSSSGFVASSPSTSASYVKNETMNFLFLKLT